MKLNLKKMGKRLFTQIIKEAECEHVMTSYFSLLVQINVTIGHQCTLKCKRKGRDNGDKSRKKEHDVITK